MTTDRIRKPLMITLRVAFVCLGLLAILDTLLISFVSNTNLGVALPALLGTPLLLVGLFLPRIVQLQATGWIRLCSMLLMIGYGLMLALFAVTWAVMDSAAHRNAEGELDAVIVLGAGLRDGRPTRVLQQRLDTAILYLETYPQAIAVLSGGQGEGEPITEAASMARYLLAKGIPAHRFLCEEQSSSTRENFSFSAALIRAQLGEDARIGFVTTDFHIFRAGQVAKKQGIAAHGIAAPDIWYISLNNHLRECVAIWLYLLRGDI